VRRKSRDFLIRRLGEILPVKRLVEAETGDAKPRKTGWRGASEGHGSRIIGAEKIACGFIDRGEDARHNCAERDIRISE
jgi:hypothetical protein